MTLVSARTYLRWSEIPILGICLGHQGLGRLLDGMVEAAPMPMHGRMSHVRHVGHGLFAGIPQGFSVVRYHSLAVTARWALTGAITAWTEDGVVMGIEHRHRPMWGVQFHPESISTEHGRALIENFYALARHHRPSRCSGREAARDASEAPAAVAVVQPASDSPLRLHIRSIEGEPSTEVIFERLFGAAEYAFWLDSADAPTRLAQCSYMGSTVGEDRCVLEYDVERVGCDGSPWRQHEGRARIDFRRAGEELAGAAIEPPDGLERGLVGGFVGYLGYECKADCGSRNVHHSDLARRGDDARQPIVAVDHVGKRTHCLPSAQTTGTREAQRWLDGAKCSCAMSLSASDASDSDASDAAEASEASEASRGVRRVRAPAAGDGG